MANTLEKFAKRNLVDIMMFSWVRCMRENFPTSSIQSGIKNFAKKNGKETADFNIDSEEKKYRRMEAEYKELQKSESKGEG